MAEDETVPEETRVQRIIRLTALTCAITAAQPLPFADILLLTPLQVGMVFWMARAMGVPLERSEPRNILASVLGVAGWGVIAQHGILGLYKIGLPFAGAITTVPLVYAATYAIGLASKAVLEARRSSRVLSAEELRNIKQQAFEDAKQAAKGLSIASAREGLRELGRLTGEAKKGPEPVETQSEEVRNTALSNDEIGNWLLKALETASFELDIMSPWIGQQVIADLREPMRRALERGTTVKILYGMPGTQPESDPRFLTTQTAAEALAEWFRSYGDRFRIRSCSDDINAQGTHGKVLICDEQFYIIGSYNFLSSTRRRQDGAKWEEIAELSHDLNLLRMYRAKYFAF